MKTFGNLLKMLNKTSSHDISPIHSGFFGNKLRQPNIKNMQDKKEIELNLSSVDVETQTRPLRAQWTRESIIDIKFSSYTIESVFRALKRVGKIKELYGIGN
jgi:hypothetical protein